MKATKILVLLNTVFLSLGVIEHSTDHSSTLLVEKEDNSWILQVPAALTTFEYEVEHSFGKSAYTTPEEFMELVLDHTQKNICIVYNGNDTIFLEKGIVKLGHETSVTYEVINTPSMLQSVLVKNTSFKDIPRNQSALMVFKKGVEKEQFVLNKKNKHTVNLNVNLDKFELANTANLHKKTTEKNQYAPYIFILTIISPILVFLFIKKNKQGGLILSVLSPKASLVDKPGLSNI